MKEEKGGGEERKRRKGREREGLAAKGGRRSLVVVGEWLATALSAFTAVRVAATVVTSQIFTLIV